MALELDETCSKERAVVLVDRVEREEELSSAMSVERLTPGDPGWPQILDSGVRPPALLYVRGKLPDLSRKVPVALVGSREATEYGRHVAETLARQWGSSGGVVVSGGALGIDSAAHEGALDAGGQTIAVLGSGLYRIYPGRNRALFERIIGQGALVSEMALTSGTSPFAFPERNRIVAGMSRAVVIVQARRGSGALYTAEFALRSSRLLFAVPGPIDDEGGEGGIGLLAAGARALTGTAHFAALFAELAGLPPSKEVALPFSPAVVEVSLSGLDSSERLVLEYLDSGQVHVDDLRRATGLEAGALSLLLLEMEMRGWVVKGAGNQYSCHVRIER